MKRMFLFLFFLVQLYGISSIQPKIVIVGAGPAGIATATYLWEHNFRNFQILEAENRIGGRVNTVNFGDGFVDLGAQWCHGERGNIVFETVKELNLLEHDDTEHTVYHSSRKDLTEEFIADFINITNSQPETNEENKTLGEILNQYFIEATNSKFGDDKENLKIAKDGLDQYHLSTLTVEGAFSWYDPSAKSTYESEGDQGLNWKGKGYKTILDVLMKKYPDPKNQIPLEDKILLNKEVEKIIWETNDNMTQIICSDKSVYEADHVIFTPSIGVLKATNEKMFVPRLPLKKREAIDNIGFGAAMKVWMYYSDPWWKNISETMEIKLIWSAEDIKSVVKEFPLGPNLDGRSWITYMSELLIIKYNPNAILVWFSGPLIPEIENISEDIMKDGMFFALNKFFGHTYEITKPEKILQTHWHNNPHFRGTYSFQTLQSCTMENICAESDLAEPITTSEGYPLIQFAGEATHLHHYSTVHGAIESGYREAKVLINYYK